MFTLTLYSQSREGSAEAYVEVVDGQPPSITVKALRNKVMNHEEGLGIEGIVCSQTDTFIEWRSVERTGKRKYICLYFLMINLLCLLTS